ncbi:MAG TPA: TlpA disulfide reductase family protein [Bacteroidales bacterium]|nr:TlpA disulfide reductase family protein [Bacteroidales bacterium]
MGIAYRNRTTEFLISPGDTLELEIDASTFPEGIACNGQHTLSHKQLYEYRKHASSKGFRDFKITKWGMETFDPKLFKNLRDSIYKTQTEFNKQFIDSTQCSPLISSWINNSAKFLYYSDLLENAQTRYFQSKGSIRLDTSYLEILDTIRLRPGYFSSLECRRFINYSALYLSLRAQDIATHSQTDSSYTDNNLREQQIYKKKFEIYLNNVNNYKDSVLRDLSITQILNQYLRIKINIIDEQVYNAVRDTVIRKRFKESVAKRKNEISLKEPLNAGSKILDGLMKKYPGRVIYLDFWATWCSPCISEMKESVKLKDVFSNDHIVVVYLCCSSEIDQWSKIVKSLGLQGEQLYLNSEQFSDLSKLLNFSGVPYSAVIKQNGKIIPDFGKISAQSTQHKLHELTLTK